MLKFHASVVEAYLGDFDIFVVHFNDEADQYLQLRSPEQSLNPRDIEQGFDG
jgi:hypothetical protein